MSVEKTAAVPYPDEKSWYRSRKDPERRVFVKQVLPGDPDGREVRGVIEHPDTYEDERSYAASREVFHGVWEKDDD